MNSKNAVLRISGITKHYGGVKALTDAHFSLRPGEHAAIVGDNGAGKSTFVRLITGVEQPNPSATRMPETLALVHGIACLVGCFPVSIVTLYMILSKMCDGINAMADARGAPQAPVA